MLAVERKGPTSNVFAHSVLIDSVNDSTYVGALKNGLFAFRASNGNVDIRSENFKVVPIGCGLSSGTAALSVSKTVNSVIGQDVLAVLLDLCRSEKQEIISSYFRISIAESVEARFLPKFSVSAPG
jgi:hypothetical protein